eukprot:6487273-Amphidinium_carterae.1
MCLQDDSVTTQKAHSFEVCTALLAKAHRFDPESQVMYTHITHLVRSLRFGGMARATWIRVSGQRLFRVPRGPRGVYLEYCRRLSIVEGDDPFVLTHASLGAIHIIDSEWGAFAHWLQECIRYRLLERAQNRRHRLHGASECDIKTTTALYRAQHCNVRAELGSILADALWCLHRKYVCELAPEETCCFCDAGCPETVEHALWQCIAWQTQRNMIPEIVIEQIEHMSPSARLCAICPRDATQELKAAWGQYQMSLAQICRMSQAANKGMTGRMP